MEELDFIIDTNASEDVDPSEVVKSSFPIFSKLKFKQGDEEDDEQQEKPSGDVKEYYGLPPSSKDTLASSSIKVKYFKKQENKKLNDDLLSAMDDYIKDLQPKKYSFVTDGIETKKDIAHLGKSENQLKKMNRNEREKTKGANWFNMKAPEVTEELKNDISVLQMRSALDPKHFYKRNEMKAVPKYFEMGQVIESPVEYHNSKDIRKTKKSLVDELLEDAQFQKYNKRKFQETVELKKQTGFNKAMKKMRKLKKKRT